MSTSVPYWSNMQTVIVPGSPPAGSVTEPDPDGLLDDLPGATVDLVVGERAERMRDHHGLQDAHAERRTLGVGLGEEGRRHHDRRRPAVRLEADPVVHTAR